jgi:hypothetical protein
MGDAVPGPADQSTAGGDELTLRTLPIPDPAAIDGLRLIETPAGPLLFYSVQVCRSPRRGLYDCQMEIRAVAPGDPTRVIWVASLPRPLPPPPRWDVRAAVGGGYQILFDEAGGALSRILLSDAVVRPVPPGAETAFQSFASPRFVRTTSAAQANAFSATLDGKALIVFADIGAPPPLKWMQLADTPDGVVGEAMGIWWVTKAKFGGVAAYNEMPGRLFLSRRSGLGAAADISTTSFPGTIAFEFDAVAIDAEIVIFATGKPAVLLLASRPARPVMLVAKERHWLSHLSRPTVSGSGGRLHIAAMANPHGDDAQVLYGDFAVDALASR